MLGDFLAGLTAHMAFRLPSMISPRKATTPNGRGQPLRDGFFKSATVPTSPAEIQGCETAEWDCVAGTQ